MPDDRTLLDEQVAYYRARAGEYDEWFERRGRYDRGPELTQRWRAEVDDVRTALDAFRPSGRVLEVAGGTGQWTVRLAAYAAELVVVDTSPEVLALNATRTAPVAAASGCTVRFEEADVYAWLAESPERFDVVFCGFWLSHVPDSRFDAFWAAVRDHLAPDGRVFLVDSRLTPGSMARDHTVPDPTGEVAERKLNDGRTYRIIKRFYRPDTLRERLVPLGIDLEVHQTSEFFLYGAGRAR